MRFHTERQWSPLLVVSLRDRGLQVALHRFTSSHRSTSWGLQFEIHKLKSTNCRLCKFLRFVSGSCVSCGLHCKLYKFTMADHKRLTDGLQRGGDGTLEDSHSAYLPAPSALAERAKWWLDVFIIFSSFFLWKRTAFIKHHLRVSLGSAYQWPEPMIHSRHLKAHHLRPPATLWHSWKAFASE